MPELKNHPLVTIIIPCFNEGVVIADSIRSVELVEYPNLEILVIDDGSTDDTFEVAMKEDPTPLRLKAPQLFHWTIPAVPPGAGIVFQPSEKGRKQMHAFGKLNASDRFVMEIAGERDANA